MHPSDDDLERYSSGQLPPDMSAVVQGHLLQCGSCQEKIWRLTRRSAGGEFEERRDIRVPVDQAALSIRVLRDDPATVYDGRLLNVSKRGMKLQLQQALHPGLLVQLRMGGKIIMAEVRYCRPHDREFHVGLEIKDVFMIPGQDPSNEARGAG